MMEKKTNAFLASFKTRAFKNGSYSLIVIAFSVLVAILCNLLITRLPQEIVKPSISPYDYYSISDVSLSLIDSVEDEITFYYIVTRGQEDDVIVEFVKRYCEKNKNFSMEYIDPTVSPGFINTYASSNIAENSLVLINQRTKVHRAVDNSEIFYLTFSSEEDYYSYYLYGTGGTMIFAADNAVTSALDYVTSSDLPILYKTAGHGEKEIASSLLKSLTSDNYTVNDLPLLTLSSIPADADAILINAPIKDMTEKEIEMLREYMKNGGKVFLLTDYTVGKLPLLYGLMEEYGMSFVDGMICEGNANYYYGTADLLRPSVTASAVTSHLSTTNLNLCAPSSHPITIKEAAGIKTTVLLKTSNTAYVKTANEEGYIDSLEKAEGDEVGTFTTACLATNEKDGGVLWLASATFMNPTSSLNPLSLNEEYLMAIFTELCGRASSISIATKALSDTALTVTSGAQSFWATILIGVIPLSCVAIGLKTWNKRRKQ